MNSYEDKDGMAQKSAAKHDALAQRVKTSLVQAQKSVSDLHQKNKRLIMAGIASSAGSTLVAGVTAATGPLVGEGDAGWRLACIVAAVFAFVSTISTGIHQQMKFSERLSKGTRCLGELRALDLSIAAGDQEQKKLFEKYEEIITTCSEFIHR